MVLNIYRVESKRSDDLSTGSNCILTMFPDIQCVQTAKHNYFTTFHQLYIYFFHNSFHLCEDIVPSVKFSVAALIYSSPCTERETVQRANGIYTAKYSCIRLYSIPSSHASCLNNGLPVPARGFN